jgi:hypothetical protein
VNNGFLLDNGGRKMKSLEGSMKLLRLAALATFLGCMALSAFPQTAQPAPDQGSAASQTAPGATEPYTIFPATPPRFQFRARKPSHDFQVLGQLRRRLKPTPPQGDFDRGIYAMQLATGGLEVCGSIMSYNFSEGEHPQLESVTTCTSASTIKSLRARGKDKKPVAPLFKTTDLKTVSPQ